MFLFVKKLIAGLLISSLLLYTSADKVLSILQNMHAEIYLTLQPDGIRTLCTIDMDVLFKQLCKPDDDLKCTYYAYTDKFDISYKNLQSGSDTTTTSCGLFNQFAESMKKPFAAYYETGELRYHQFYNDEDQISRYLKMHVFRVFESNIDELSKLMASNEVSQTMHDSESCKVHYITAKKIPIPDGYLFQVKKTIDMKTCTNTDTLNITLDASCSDISEKPIVWDFEQTLEGIRLPNLLTFVNTKIVEQNTYKPWKEIDGTLTSNKTIITKLMSIDYTPLDIDMNEKNSQRLYLDPPRIVDEDLVAQSDKGDLTKLYGALTCINTNYRSIDAAVVKLTIQCESQK